MDKDFVQTNPKVLNYVAQTFTPEDRILLEIRERTTREGMPPIQVGKMDGLLLEVLTRLMHATKVVEIGTLAGYSGVCIARGLAPGGVLHTFEYDQRNAAIAQESFRWAGLSDRVEIHVGEALEQLPKIEEEGPFDLIFIDADKENYPHYLSWAEKNLRIGGAVIGDNTFAFGMIGDDRIDDPEDEETVRAIRLFNQRVADRNGRFRATILPTGEGLTIAVKVR